jgi:hypothetical protein
VLLGICEDETESACVSEDLAVDADELEPESGDVATEDVDVDGTRGAVGV